MRNRIFTRASALGILCIAMGAIGCSRFNAMPLKAYDGRGNTAGVKFAPEDFKQTHSTVDEDEIETWPEAEKIIGQGENKVLLGKFRVENPKVAVDFNSGFIQFNGVARVGSHSQEIVLFGQTDSDGFASLFPTTDPDSKTSKDGIVRAKATCLEKGEDGRYGCQSLFVDVYIEINGERLAAQYNLKKSTVNVAAPSSRPKKSSSPRTGASSKPAANAGATPVASSEDQKSPTVSGSDSGASSSSNAGGSPKPDPSSTKSEVDSKLPVSPVNEDKNEQDEDDVDDSDLSIIEEPSAGLGRYVGDPNGVNQLFKTAPPAPPPPVASPAPAAPAEPAKNNEPEKQPSPVVVPKQPAAPPTPPPPVVPPVPAPVPVSPPIEPVKKPEPVKTELPKEQPKQKTEPKPQPPAQLPPPVAPPQSVTSPVVVAPQPVQKPVAQTPATAASPEPATPPTQKPTTLPAPATPASPSPATPAPATPPVAAKPAPPASAPAPPVKVDVKPDVSADAQFDLKSASTSKTILHPKSGPMATEANGVVRPIDQVKNFYANGSLERSSELQQSPLAAYFIVGGVGVGNYGAYVMVEFIDRMAKFVQSMIPGYRLGVGNIARKNGGVFPGHSSHQNGLDADFAYITTDPPRFEDIRARGKPGELLSKVRIAENWKLFVRITQSGLVSQIGMDEGVRQGFCKYAKQIGEPDSGNQVMQYFSPWPGHQDHFHLRLKCTDFNPRCQNERVMYAQNRCK